MSKAVQECGMVPAHAEVFAKVAKDEDTVVVSRALNVESTALLIEHYAAKGFHVKAKTCNWGPMAGFVCADARFTKNPKEVATQLKYLTSAYKDGATKTQIIISDARLKALTGKQFTIAADEKTKLTLHCKSPIGDDFTFIAIHGKAGWALYYSAEESKSPQLGTHLANGVLDTSLHLMPLYAMVNPGSGSRGHLDAIAGDYDLFGLYPPRDTAKSDSHTHRAVDVKPTVSKNASEKIKELAKAFTEVSSQELEKEHQDLGNITPVILKFKKLLNDGIAKTGYKGGEIVMHSDESGNPFSSAPDYPLLAFVPGEEPKALHSEPEFIAFIKAVNAAGYRATLNPRWRVQNFKVVKSGKEVGGR